MSLRLLAIAFVALPGLAATTPCELREIAPGGGPVGTRLIAAPLPRVQEAVRDAMQASGVLLFKIGDRSVEGERVPERVKALGLAGGDEAVRATLTSSTVSGASGTSLRVETLRRGSKEGMPKHSWSGAILDQAVCLVALLSLDDPLHRAASSQAPGEEVRLPDSTMLEVRSRHFFFNTEIKPNQTVAFETVAPVMLNQSTVIPSGMLVGATVDQSTDIKEFGRGASGRLKFKYLVLPDGTHLPLRGAAELRGKGVNKAGLGGLAAVGIAIGSGASGAASVTGLGFAIPAGALFSVALDGEQVFRVAWRMNSTREQQ